MSVKIEESIFRPQGDKTQEAGDENFDTRVYTTKKHSKNRVNGDAIILDAEDDTPADQHQHAYAKEVQFTNCKRYYIKYSGGNLINPLGLYTNDIYKKVGEQSAYKWKEVNKKAFQFFTAFLKTQNEAYYRNAERAMI